MQISFGSPVADSLAQKRSVHVRAASNVWFAERCFGSTGEAPFDGQKLQARADKAWRAAGLERITPHEAATPSPR